MAKIQSAMLDGKTQKVFLRFLLPSFGAMVVNSIYIVADTIFIGQYSGEEGISALTIIMPLFSFFYALGVFFGVGGSILYSVEKGKGSDEGKKYFTAALLSVITIGLMLTVLLNVFFYPIMSFLGASKELMPYVEVYGKNVTYGALVFILNGFIGVFIRNDGAPVLAMIGVVSSGILNIILDYLLMFLLGLGLAGASLATLISSSISVIVCFSHLFRARSGLKFKFKGAAKTLPQIVSNGFTTLVLELAPGVIMLLFNNILQFYGGENGLYYVAAYGVVSNIMVVFTSLFSGISNACQPLMSINFGANKVDRIKQFFKHGLVSAAILSVVLYLAVAIKPGIYMKIFVQNPNPFTIKILPSALRIYCLCLFTMGYNLLIGSYFQSTLKKGRALFLSVLKGLALPGIFVTFLPSITGKVGSIWFVIPVAETLALLIIVLLWQIKRNKIDYVK